MNTKTKAVFRRRLKKIIWNSPFLFNSHSIVNKGRMFCQQHFLEKPPLKVLVVEVTNHCNLSCTICGNKLITREKGFMDDETFDAAINGLPKHPLSFICMFAQGEPLLHPRLPELIQEVRFRANERLVSTNALLALANPELPERLIRAGMNHLHCSGDGYDAATYERVRINGKFSDFLKSLVLFKNARDRFNTNVVFELLYCVSEHHTREGYNRVFETYEHLVDEIVFKPKTSQANTRILADLGQSYLGFRYFLTEKKRPCQWLWRAPTVLWDGRVSACCRNYEGELIMGNVHESPLIKIWQGRKYRSLRRDHVQGHFPEECQGCTDLHDDDSRIALMNRWIRKQLGRPDFKVF